MTANTYPDWRSPTSDLAKLALIKREWGAQIDNTYLWYEIGPITRLTNEEVATIVKQCFVHHTVGFGDVEIHPSMLIQGAMLLRLRGTLFLQPALTIRNRYCPLYQVGHGGGFVTTADDDCVNFHRVWELDAKETEVGPIVLH
ncbi:hypothetical protein HYW18_03410 [Candidatus Uhrbacteria bacterium]|nr:hypothetical protein [Candidatus Uhrbacteria bacterium]